MHGVAGMHLMRAQAIATLQFNCHLAFLLLFLLPLYSIMSACNSSPQTYEPLGDAEGFGEAKELVQVRDPSRISPHFLHADNFHVIQEDEELEDLTPWPVTMPVDCVWLDIWIRECRRTGSHSMWEQRGSDYVLFQWQMHYFREPCFCSLKSCWIEHKLLLGLESAWINVLGCDTELVSQVVTDLWYSKRVTWILMAFQV